MSEALAEGWAEGEEDRSLFLELCSCLAGASPPSQGHLQAFLVLG